MWNELSSLTLCLLRQLTAEAYHFFVSYDETHSLIQIMRWVCPDLWILNVQTIEGSLMKDTIMKWKMITHRSWLKRERWKNKENKGWWKLERKRNESCGIHAVAFKTGMNCTGRWNDKNKNELCIFPIYLLEKIRWK